LLAVIFGAVLGTATGSARPGNASARFDNAGSMASGETAVRWMSRLVSTDDVRSGAATAGALVGVVAIGIRSMIFLV
jgi:hypothetical protein